MSDKPSPQGVFEKVGKIVGDAVDTVADEFGQIVKTASNQVVPQKPLDPEEQKKMEEQKAKDETRMNQIKKEFHELAEKLDQPNAQELEQRELEKQKQIQEEELQKQKAREEKAGDEPVALPTSVKRGIDFNRQKQPISVQRASTKREANRGTSG